MWQTDTEQSEALEQVGAERPDVLVDINCNISNHLISDQNSIVQVNQDISAWFLWLLKTKYNPNIFPQCSALRNIEIRTQPPNLAQTLSGFLSLFDQWEGSLSLFDQWEACESPAGFKCGQFWHLAICFEYGWWIWIIANYHESWIWIIAKYFRGKKVSSVIPVRDVSQHLNQGDI